jgi:hypothetical protein
MVKCLRCGEKGSEYYVETDAQEALSGIDVVRATLTSRGADPKPIDTV